jgi:hypothetical protein
MLGRLVGIILLFLTLDCSAAVSELALRNLPQSSVVRSQPEAQKRATNALATAQSASVQLFGKVLELSRAHVEAGPIKRGEWVWLVAVMNAGASDLNPIPEALVWVRAEDAVVVRLGGDR